jgi:serine O-acetyltransferase
MNTILNLFNQKMQKGALSLVDGAFLEHFLSEAIALVYPGMVKKYFSDVYELQVYFDNHLNDCKKLLRFLELESISVKQIVKNYQNHILEINTKLESDAQSILSGDPAAKNFNEVLLCYPGVYAIAVYRIAHFFYQSQVPIIPRFFSEIAHQKTGIDIHPGAKIGESFFIDHGTGVVIGETAEIGNHVKIYQGVTLGALSVEKKLASTKRHPTIKDHCIIYAHATILGGETVIGEHSVIGGNVWITKSIPAHSLVYHKSEVKLSQLDKDKKGEHKIHQQEELTYDI